MNPKVKETVAIQEALKVVADAEGMLLRWWEEEQILSNGTQSRYSKRAPYGLGAQPPLDSLAKIYDHLRKVVESINTVKLRVQQLRDQMGKPVNKDDQQLWYLTQIRSLGRRAKSTRDIGAPILRRKTK